MLPPDKTPSYERKGGLRMKRLLGSVLIITAVLGCMPNTGASASYKSTGLAIPSVLTCGGKSVVKPSSYVLACADANTYFDAVHWTSWGRKSATATAIFVENNCDPTCAAGKFLKYPAKLALSQPKSTKLGLLFSVVNYSYTVSATTTLPLTTLSGASQ